MIAANLSLFRMILMVAVGLGPDGENTLPQDALISLSNAYTSNTSSFVHGTIEFACDLDLGQGSRRATGRCVFDPDKILYSLLYSEADMLSDAMRVTSDTSGNRGYVVHLSSFQFVTNGKDTLWDIPTPFPEERLVKHRVHIVPAADEIKDRTLLPLMIHRSSFDKHSVANNITAILERKPDYKFLSLTQGQSNESVVLKFRYARSLCTFNIDLSKGAVPQSVVREGDDGSRFEVLYSDIRQVQNAGWLPYKAEYKLPNSQSKHITITKAEFGRQPSDTAYTLTFDQPLPILHKRLGSMASGRSSAGLKELTSLSGPKIRHVNVENAPGEVPNFQIENSRNIGFYEAAAVVACAITILLLLRYLRRSK